ARRSAPQDETALPHVQRLHDRASQRACLGLLPAGSVFCEARARRAAETDQEDGEGGDQRVIERRPAHAAVTAFLALFSIVGIALYGLPFFYDFFVRDLGWTRAQVTSGNALSKVIIGPLFGFAASWTIDRFGPRRLMLVGLGSVTTLGFFYACYMLNALGNVCGGPLPNQVLLARWFDRNRGKAMGFA